MVIHGQHDILAEPKFGRDLAQKLKGEYIELDGAHLIKRECRSEVRNCHITSHRVTSRHIMSHRFAFM